MRKVYVKRSGQLDGSLLLQTILVGHSINHKTLDAKFGIREEGFLDLENERELTLSKPEIFVCNSSRVRKILNAKSGEKVFVIKQVHKENFI
jgi:hypothetical protein